MNKLTFFSLFLIFCLLSTFMLSCEKNIVDDVNNDNNKIDIVQDSTNQDTTNENDSETQDTSDLNTEEEAEINNYVEDELIKDDEYIEIGEMI